jgi:hypothetical protein
MKQNQREKKIEKEEQQVKKQPKEQSKEEAQVSSSGSDSDSNVATIIQPATLIEEQVVKEVAVEANLNGMFQQMKDMVEMQQASLEAKQGQFEKKMEEQMVAMFEFIQSQFQEKKSTESPERVEKESDNESHMSWRDKDYIEEEDEDLEDHHSQMKKKREKRSSLKKKKVDRKSVG